MKILFYRYGSICEPDIIEAFTIHGHEIVEINNEVFNKAVSPEETMKLVVSQLNSFSFGMVFTINFYPIISEVCNIYKIRYCSLIVDSPVMELFSHSIANEWNRVFVFDKIQYQEIHAYNPKHIFHLPLATNFMHSQKIIANAGVKLLRNFSSEISFVGSLYTEKCSYDRLKNPSPYTAGYLNAILEAQLKVYGYYFIDSLLTEDIIKDFREHLPHFYTPVEKTYLDDRIIMSQLYVGNKISALERTRIMQTIAAKYSVDIYTGSDTSEIAGIHNRGFAKSRTEMPIIFNQSRINLNITSKSIRSGIPLRIWDILGCGGFCLTNYQTELMDYFVPGEHLDYYGSFEELEEKLEYYLSHEKERQEIAENGKNLVKEQHRYDIRMLQLMETAFSI